MAAEVSSVALQLEAARKQLLDLGLRNPLLNYHPLRARGVEIVDERSAEVFRTLAQGKRMSFLPVPEPGDSAAATQLAQPEDETASVGPVVQRTETHLQTSHTPDTLQSRLLNTHYAAKTFIEEQGVNILYMALGMLTWFESGSSQKDCKAPLILVPVLLERGSALDRFYIRYTDDEVSDNLSLVEKLRADFGITLPRYDGEAEITTYFAAISAAVAGQARWSVNADAVALGFFSFSKFLMYRDLDTDVWPDTNKPSDHPILQALLNKESGFGRTSLEFDEQSSLDRQYPAESLKHIVDADSSQAMAILQATTGHSMAIQGPPGTGKSQTITNLVADALGSGKTVLFVSEKMAALEVVYRRLTDAGLGSACLELHSNKARKRELLDDLKRALNESRAFEADTTDRLAMLEAVRAPLNDYCEAMNTPIGASNRTPFQALGASLLARERLQLLAAPLLEMSDLANLSEAGFATKREIVRRLQQLTAALGDPTASPFWGTKRTSLSPIEQQQLAGRLDHAQTAIIRLQRSMEQLRQIIALHVEDNRLGAQALSRAAGCFELMPVPLLIDVSRNEWTTQAPAIRSLIEQGTRLTTIQRDLENVLRPDAWATPVTELREQLATHGTKLLRFLSGEYRTAKARLSGLCMTRPPSRLSEQLELLDKLIEVQTLQPRIEDQAVFATSLFGTLWQGPRTDWVALAVQAGWAIGVHADVQSGVLPEAFLTVLRRINESTIPLILNERKQLEAALSEHHEAINSALAALELGAPAGMGGRAVADVAFVEQQNLFQEWRANLSQLVHLANFNAAQAQCRAQGLSKFADLSLGWSGARQGMVDLLERARSDALLDRALRERPALANFDRAQHEATVEQFRTVDARMLQLARINLLRQYRLRLPHLQDAGQLGILRREFEKKTRLISIRQLMERAGNVVQAIKPVFMMSPLSIANFLPPGIISFDLVIFDEASQVKPVDAFGAIIRGKQTIVVGDDRQLPPTSFFDKVTSEADDDEEEQTTSDIESILGLFRAQGAAQRMLHWHYRSRHESLIAISNQEFYENKLIIFPSPDRDKAAAGLRFHHLPGTSYDRSKSRTNRGEAAAVAAAVMQHARQTPHFTLGVAAFSTAQRQAIEDELEHLRRTDKACEAFFNANPSEPFFIKNLENVQGDERDVILISIGYGKSADGKLAMNFGPLNRQGGERRLNVLISRARLRCEVFSNITAADLRIDGNTPFGVRSLKLFLDYAESGLLSAQAPSDREPDSLFEIAVRERLIARGYDVAIQVGTAGYFIDLAIVDPERPGRYILGIECDGATYHSARSARDRDRLRQTVLENLGWQIHRIWSTDWFRDPEHEIQRIVERLDMLRLNPPHGSQPALPAGEAGHESDAPDTGYTDPGTTNDSAQQTLNRPSNTGQSRTANSSSSNANSSNDQSTTNYGKAASGGSAASNGGRTMPPSLPRYEAAKLDLRALKNELHEAPPNVLLPYVMTVVETEGPVHVDEVGRRIIEARGIQRRGTRIQEAFSKTFTLGVRQGHLRKEGDFLWLPTMTKPTLRDRSAAPDNTRKLEMIAPEEIALAVIRVVESSYGMEPAELPAATCRVFGFQRVSEDMRLRVEGVIKKLITDGRLEQQGIHLVVKKG